MSRQKNTAPYILRQDKTSTVVMEAANRIMHHEGYVSIYEHYPAQQTKILLCRVVKEADKQAYGYLFHKLFRNTQEGEHLVCCCIPEKTVYRESEVQEAITKAVRGRELFQKTLSQFTGGHQ